MCPDFEKSPMCVSGHVKLRSLLPSHEEINFIEVNSIISCTVSFVNKQDLQDFGLVYLGYFSTALISHPVKVSGQKYTASVQILLVMSSHRNVFKVSERWNIWESQPAQKLLLQYLLHSLHPTYASKHNLLTRTAFSIGSLGQSCFCIKSVM